MKDTPRIVALLPLLLSLVFPCASQTGSSRPEAASSTKAVERIVVTTTVTNKKGNLVPGLLRDNFQISIDKEPANIVDFSDADVPLSVGIVFDASRSVVGWGSGKSVRRFIDSLQQALARFLEVGNKSNEYFLLAFNDKPELLADWTSDSKMLLDSLSGLKPYGMTALYDACYLAIDKLQHGRYSKHVLILISDGQDNNSNYRYKQVAEVLGGSDVLLYSVTFPQEDAVLAMEGRDFLKDVSSISGGRSFYQKEGVRLKASDAASVFEIIAAELRHQYTIGIKPQLSKADSNWHKIKVKVSPPADGSRETKDLSARTREGFYWNHR